MILALLVALFFALHNFILGNLANLGYLARLISGIGMLLCSLGYHAHKWLMKFRDGESYFTWETSLFRNRETDKVEYWIIIALILNSINVAIGGFGVIYSFKFALDSNINQGVITSIFGLTPFVTAILFYGKVGNFHWYSPF